MKGPFEPTALTSSLKKMIDRDVMNNPNREKAEKAFHYYENGIEFYKKQFEKIPDPISRAYTMQIKVDETLNKLKQNPAFKEVKCQKGCAHCCYNPVVANVEEAQLLLMFCEEEKITIDWERVMKQAKFVGNDHEYFLQPKSESRCVFLDPETNSCRAYKFRPASCRKYFVGSDPSTCDDREGTQEVAVLADMDAELIVSGFMDVNHDNVGLLPKMLMRAQADRPAHCNHCQKTTETKEWDCKDCGLSKGHPHGN